MLKRIRKTTPKKVNRSNKKLKTSAVVEKNKKTQRIRKSAKGNKRTTPGFKKPSAASKKKKRLTQKAKPGVKKIARRAKKIEKVFGKALIKSEDNPVISPEANNDWEAWQTFNPGVILLNDKVHFLYRAIGNDGISRFGYAGSYDGFHIEERLSYPVYEHKIGQKPSFNIFSYFSGGSFGGAEDPRIVRVNGEDTLYVTYTACDNGLRVALTSIKIQDFLNKKWNWKQPVLISPPGEVHKNWVIFPEKINGKYAVLHSISPKILIDYFEDLDFEKHSYVHSYHNGESGISGWSVWVRGAGAPPIKTKYGWLLFYHAMDEDMSKYKVGAMLLDLKNPTKILRCADEPVLEPKEEYENKGYKPGIVYVSGAIVKNGLLMVYYGAADSYVAVAYADFEEFVEVLARGSNPKLQSKSFKRKLSA